MSPLLDAHAHFFSPGYVERLPESCRRITPDEITLYTALAERHEIRQTLAIGYEGEAWARGNNAYLASLAATRSWLRPLAYQSDPAQLSVSGLERLQAQGFVGISLYVLDESAADASSRLPLPALRWLAAHGWLVSVNCRGNFWRAWRDILERCPDLRLLVSHLGLPPAVSVAPSVEDATAAMADVIALAAYRNVHVKLSGFYALSEPGHAYPHSSVHPYVTALTCAFSAGRLLWGSDFSPALEVVSFAQTIHVVQAMKIFDDEERARIYHGNLQRLLEAVEGSSEEIGRDL